MGREKVSREKIIETLTNPELFLRKEQAEALHITPKTLWLRRKEDPTIDEDVAKIIKENTSNMVARGLQRLETIIDGRCGDSADAIRALKLLLQYRGELEGDNGGAVVNIIMPNRNNKEDNGS